MGYNWYMHRPSDLRHCVHRPELDGDCEAATDTWPENEGADADWGAANAAQPEPAPPGNPADGGAVDPALADDAHVGHGLHRLAAASAAHSTERELFPMPHQTQFLALGSDPSRRQRFDELGQLHARLIGDIENNLASLQELFRSGQQDALEYSAAEDLPSHFAQEGDKDRNWASNRATNRGAAPNLSSQLSPALPMASLAGRADVRPLDDDDSDSDNGQQELRLPPNAMSVPSRHAGSPAGT
jgi:hypothetical protein